MMSRWHFNVIFVVGMISLLALLFGPEFGIKIGDNPTAITAVGALITYILTQKQALVKEKKEDNSDTKDGTE